MKEMPLFARTFDLVEWLVRTTNHFPRSQRFVVTKRLLDCILDFQEAIISANNCRGCERQLKLRQADERLDLVRFYLRLAARWRWVTPGQYQHAAKMISEVGRLLGGWHKVSS